MSVNKKKARAKYIKYLPKVGDFEKKLYLGEFDKQLDFAASGFVERREPQILGGMCWIAYMKVMHGFQDAFGSMEQYKKEAERLSPYMKASKGFTQRFAYFFALRFGYPIEQKNIFKIAEELGVSAQKLHRHYLDFAYHKKIDEDIKAEAESMLKSVTI